MVGEIVAVGLAGSQVQPERVQRLAVIGELGLAVRAVDPMLRPIVGVPVTVTFSLKLTLKLRFWPSP